jgi:hypothetical protein
MTREKRGSVGPASALLPQFWHHLAADLKYLRSGGG